MDEPFFRRLFSRPPKLDWTNAEGLAEHGDAEAQFYVGLKYASGEGLAQDYKQAADWYLKAAAENHVLAQFNLGIMYANGQGVSRNEAEAEVWFGKAAQQGDAGAQHHLGMERYRTSIRNSPEIMRESRIEAYKWFRLAATQGYRGSVAAGATVALKMTREDVAEATERADQFVHSISGSSTNL